MTLLRAHRVAVMNDVHGNLPALEAVLAEAATAGADLLVFGGDIALGPMPCEVIDRVMTLGTPAVSLRGNCDRLMVEAFDGGALDGLPPPVAGALRWAAGEIGRERRDFLASLPATITVSIDGMGEVLFCHATPRSDEEIVTVRTPEPRLMAVLDDVAVSTVVCGHTHMQFRRRVDTVELVNAGSVGMPFGAPGAHWLLLGPDVEMRRTAYDTARAAAEITRTSYPGAQEFAERQIVKPPTEEDMLRAFGRVDGG